jgi:hypothetical protein
MVGTVTGVLALGWQIFIWWRTGRPRLKLTSDVMTDLDYPDQPTYWIRVTNHGGKATRIETFGLRPPEHGVNDDRDIGAPLSQVITSDRPRRMKPYDQIELYWDGPSVEAICKRDGFRPEDVRPWVRQTTGDVILGPPLPRLVGSALPSWLRHPIRRIRSQITDFRRRRW